MKSWRLGLLIPWALFALVCGGWTYYWFTAKDAAIAALDAGIARAEQSGVAASYSRVRAAGFPLRLTLTLSDASATLGAPALRLDADALPVTVNLSNPRHVVIGRPTNLRWEGADRTVHRLAAARAEVSVRFTARNTLARVSLDLEDAVIAQTEGEATGIGRLLAHLRPDPRDPDDGQLVIDATDWRGPTPFGALNAAGPFAHFRAAVVASDYASIASPEGLAGWNGVLRIERLDVAYAGTSVTGSGEIALDDARRARGVLRLKPATGAPVELRAADGWWTLAGLRVAPARPLYAPPPD